ncbi:5-histidylcysteine sulfoxide synthase [Aurantivibrio infirmus]
MSELVIGSDEELSQLSQSKFANDIRERKITRSCLLTGNSVEKKREEIRNYFHSTYTLNECLFECLASEEAFRYKANSLRHPLIFYYGHTAVFFVNKLHVAKLIPARLDAEIESMLAIGVDEMSWDDLDENHYQWPSSKQVKLYRDNVRKLVDDFICSAELKLPISWGDPFWIIMMAIEHERIHLETSSVLIRQLPIELVKPNTLFADCTESGVAPNNSLQTVSGRLIEQNKDKNDRLYGWDNEYGKLSTKVSDFKASQFLVSNKEFLAFVEAGAYQKQCYWTEEGWDWLSYANVSQPEFWIADQNTYKYRSMTQIIPMPWDWPVDVNYLEAKAFCNWKSEKLGKPIRLPTEAEWYCLRNEIPEDLPDWEHAPGNINLEYWASACPVNKFATACSNGSTFYDVIGNVWQWTETPIDGLPGFEVHPVYDDFSTPTFDGKHNLIKGGSFFSTGNYAIKDSRYAFRRHFFQHAGFRYIESEVPVKVELNPYETDDQVSQYLEFHYGDEYFGVANFAKACADLCLKFMEDKKTVRALDLGCAVGRSSFELAKVFDHVDGVDFSARFIAAAAELQESEIKRYTIKEEGELVNFKEAQLQALGLAATASRCQFMQADACNLNEKFDRYNLIFAGNLIDRLYSPKKFLSMIGDRLEKSGVLILTSPYTWLEEFTEKEEWLGGIKINGESYTTLDGLKECLSEQFDMISEPIDVPFVIRETGRKFQHTVSQMTVWQLK